MPSALSNLDFIQFTSDYPQYNGVNPAFNMQPAQSALVNWNDRIILVYNAPDTITVNDNVYPDVYYTDVSDASQLQALQNPNFTAPPQSMLDTLPQSIKDIIAEDAAAAGAMVNQLGQQLKAYIAAAAAPIISDLTPLLLGALVIVFLMYGPRQS